jgi:hypothetical protein
MTETYDEALILGYVEGDLTTEQKRAFEAQLLRDARLRNLVAQLIQDRNHLRQMAVEQAPSQIMTAVNEQLERDMLLHGDVRHPVAASPAPARRTQTRPTRDAMEQFQLSRWMGYSAIAAVLLLVAGLITYMVQDPGLVDRVSYQQALETADARSSGTTATEAKGGAAQSLSADEPLLAMGAASEAAEPAPVRTPAAVSAPRDAAEAMADVAVDESSVPPAAPAPAATLALSAPQERTSADVEANGSGGVATSAGLAMRAARTGAMSRSAPAATAAPASAPVQVADSGMRRESAAMTEGVASPAPAAKAQAPSLPPIELQRQASRKRADDLGVRQGQAVANDVVIEITSAAPERSQQQVVEWASVNQVAAPTVDHDGAAGGERTRIGAALGKDQQQGVVQTMLRADGARQIEMSIVAQQVPVLLAHLNRQEGQQVRLRHVEREGPALTASQREWRSLLSQVAPLAPVIPLLTPDAPTRVSVIIRSEHHAQDEVGR